MLSTLITIISLIAYAVLTCLFIWFCHELGKMMGTLEGVRQLLAVYQETNTGDKANV